MGICYGHQILGHIFGGRVATLDKPIIDSECRLEMSRKVERALLGMVGEMKVFVEHRDYVSTVPQGFEIIAEKKSVPQIIHNPERAIYGMQFVPEMSGHEGREIMRRFILG